MPGRLETVFVTASGAGFLNGWIDFNRDGDFDAPEKIFTDRAVISGVNRLTYNVPRRPLFAGGHQRPIPAHLGYRPVDVAHRPRAERRGGGLRRILFDAAQEALDQCPRGSIPVPIGIIQNASLEDWERTFTNSSANTINNAEHWFDSHPSGGQYYVFSPAFDSGPAASVMPFRAGADGYGFLGGHSCGPETAVKAPATPWQSRCCLAPPMSGFSRPEPAATAATAAATCGCSAP